MKKDFKTKIRECIIKPTDDYRVADVKMKFVGIDEEQLAFPYYFWQRNPESKAEEDMNRGIQVIDTLISIHGLVDLDVADFKSVFQDNGRIFIASGLASRNDKNSIYNAFRNAVSSYYKEGFDIIKSKNLIIAISSSDDVLMEEMEGLNDAITYTDDACFKWGLYKVDGLENRIRVDIIATEGTIDTLRIEKNKTMYPKFPVPIEGMKELDYLRMLVEKGAIERYGNTHSSDVQNRIDYELDEIGKEECASYFLIWQEIIQAAREEIGALVGPGRSSSAGSIVNYCLGITAINPLEYGLSFVKFFHKTTFGNLILDIDIDIDEKHRDDVVAWVEKKYGNHFAHISTYLTNKEGIVDDIQIHQCGIVLCAKPIEEVSRLHYVKDKDGHDVKCTVYGGYNVEDIGLVKLDFLSYNALSQIQETINQISIDKGISIKLSEIPLEDAETLRLFQEGKTTSIPMFDGISIRKYLRKMEPDNFMNLVLLNAMFRPGPIDYIPEMIGRKNGTQTYNNKFPCLNDILEETYGIFVYQEQLMVAAQRIANFTPIQCYRLYRAFGYRKQDWKDELIPLFLKGGIENGYREDDLKSLLSTFDNECWLLFSKSHAVCYVRIAYVCAYLKTYFLTIYNSCRYCHRR